MDVKTELKDILRSQGFELVGFTRPDPPMHLDVYLDWIDAGLQAGMTYLSSQRAVDHRANPARIMTSVRTIVVVGLRYYPPVPPPDRIDSPLAARVAAYALGADYHHIIPPRLDQAGRIIQERLGLTAAWRAYTDTGPILERDYAMAAGLGWIGKNTCLISPENGSYFLLGEIFLDIDLEADAPFEADYCGSCRRCIEACPTDCIQENRTLDSSRCISYLTIENKGEIPLDLRPQVDNWIFGCDICQQVCPWNIRFSAPTGDPELAPRAEQPGPQLYQELRLSPQEFNRKYKGSPIQRARRRGYLRNIAVALGNRRDPEAIPDLRSSLLDENEPLVRAHAAWALGQIGGADAEAALELARQTETDSRVLAEIERALRK